MTILKLLPGKKERLGDPLYGQILEQIVSGAPIDAPIRDLPTPEPPTFVLAGFAGVGWTGSAAANPDQDLARDLRLIENKRFYDHVDDLEFLNSLDQSDLFDDDESGS